MEKHLPERDAFLWRDLFLNKLKCTIPCKFSSKLLEMEEGRILSKLNNQSIMFFLLLTKEKRMKVLKP